jgi:hypothetical protein
MVMNDTDIIVTWNDLPLSVREKFASAHIDEVNHNMDIGSGVSNSMIDIIAERWATRKYKNKYHWMTDIHFTEEQWTLFLLRWA